MIPFVCFKWHRESDGKRFGAAQVNALADMLHDRVGGGATLLCLTDERDGLDAKVEAIDIPDHVAPLTRQRQWAKLYLFSREFGAWMGRRFVYLDLDVVVVDDLTPIHEQPGDLVVAQASRPLPPKPGLWRKAKRWLRQDASRWRRWVNSSLMVIEPGRSAYLWDQFRLEDAERTVTASGLKGSDQAWIELKAENPMLIGSEMGVHRISDIPPGAQGLPEGARLVFTPGLKHKPWYPETRAVYPWIADFYPVESSASS